MDRLGAVLVELAELLDSCGEHDRAERLRAASDSLARADPSEEEALRSEVASWNRGMGSLTDLYLRPFPRSVVQQAGGERSTQASHG